MKTRPHVLACAAIAWLTAACSSSSTPDTAGVDASSPTGGGLDASSSSDGAPPTTGGDAGADATTGAADASDAGIDDDVLAPLPDGGELVPFVASDETTYFDKAAENVATGTIAFGQPDPGASDNAVARLRRTGGQGAIGTAGAEEIVSQRMFPFGTFRFRLSLATCASSEEVVNGPFAYFNDGSLATDGLVINREIDIEILCGEPWFINLTIWTEYTDDTHFKNQARVVDTRTGSVAVYANDQQGVQTGTEAHPELAIPGWPAAGTFYEMGWTWAPDHLRYFIVIGGQELTLWDATDATRIPQLPMEQHFNIWAPGIHWSTGDTAATPANDATLTLDWFRYDPK